MLKTKKEIEKEFDEQLFPTVIFEQGEIENMVKIQQLFDDYVLKVKAFIHKTRIADLEEMEKLLMERKKEVEESGFVTGYAIGTLDLLNELITHIQKVKEEIGK